jgi:hypothetical protein
MACANACLCLYFKGLNMRKHVCRREMCAYVREFVRLFVVGTEAM